MPNRMTMPLQRHPELNCDDLDVRRRTIALMRDLTIRPEVRAALDAMGHLETRNAWGRTAGKRAIETAAHEIVILLAAGATRGEVTLLPALLHDLIEELCEDGSVGVDRLTLELEHMRLDAQEDVLQGPALVETETPEEMLARAAALRAEASSGFALARRLEGTVRRRRLGLHQRTA